MTEQRLRELESLLEITFRTAAQQDELADAAPELIRMVRRLTSADVKPGTAWIDEDGLHFEVAS